MKYAAVYECVGCHGRLSWDQRMLSDGICPLCGRVSPGWYCEANKLAVPVNPAVNPAANPPVGLWARIRQAIRL